MTPGSISKRIVLDRLTWVDRMLAEIRSLPLSDQQVFFSDGRNVWTAESCLRRALEALFDLGRHGYWLAIGIDWFISITRLGLKNCMRSVSLAWAILSELPMDIDPG